MSHFATPFIVVNLGCEMIYVIDQRLKAQNIETDKSQRVLTDIVSVLLHPKLLEELFIPQPVARHAVIKQLLQDISATSIMKLDDYSMNKLWDLMTMICKWQVSVAQNQNIFDITRRHLRNVAILMPQYFPKRTIEEAMKKFESLGQRFTDEDYKCLYSTLIFWFSEYHTKISVLLRLGLQKKDGKFCIPTMISPKILLNLGENIYKYDKKAEEYEKHCADTNEISCLLAPIDITNMKQQTVELHLPIEFGNNVSENKTVEITKNTHFENININVKTKDTNLTFTPNIPKSPRDDLLEMLENIN